MNFKMLSCVSAMLSVAVKTVVCIRYKSLLDIDGRTPQEVKEIIQQLRYWINAEKIAKIDLVANVLFMVSAILRLFA